MADGKKTFIFYSDWINMIREMPNEDAGALLKHVLSYVNDENPQTDNLLVKMAFGHMKPMLKRDLDKWEKQLKRYSEMGKLSAEKRALNQDQPKLTYVEPTSTVNDNDNVNNINNIYNKFVDEVKKGNHSQAVDMMYMKLKIKKGSLTPLLKEFKGQLIIDQTLHKTTLELRKHFNNWLNTQERVGKLNQYKLKT